ncbi:unnamed protein product [Rhodiola kirilowii]
MKGFVPLILWLEGSSAFSFFLVDIETDVAAGQPTKRTFRKFSFRGVDLDALLDMSTDELVKLFTARARRRFQRGLKRKPMALIKKLQKAQDKQLDTLRDTYLNVIIRSHLNSRRAKVLQCARDWMKIKDNLEYTLDDETQAE